MSHANGTSVPDRISVIGLGKLGACYSAFYASHGFDVLGVDSDEKKVAAVNEGRPPVSEPGLAKMMAAHAVRLSATTSLGPALSTTDVTFVIVPTPSKRGGAFSLRYVLDFARHVGPLLRRKPSYHLFVLVSTVLPEDSRNTIIPALEKHSGKTCGKDFGYCYSPSLIALGDVLRNLSEPDFLFLGMHDPAAGELLRGIYKKAYGDRPVEPMSVESAELAKISLNSYLTLKITFANVLGEIAHRIPRADVDEVTAAIGKDARIGHKFFRSGLGYGGPCFPRDNMAFAHMAKVRGVRTPIASTVHALNELIPDKVCDLVAESVKRRSPVGVLTVSYKPGTHVTEESQALKVAERLADRGHRVTVYEPSGYEQLPAALRQRVQCAASLEQLLGCAAVVIGNPDARAAAELRTLLRASAGGPAITIIDPWGMFAPGELPERVSYVSVGRKGGRPPCIPRSRSSSTASTESGTSPKRSIPSSRRATPTLS